jgi:thermitase
MEKIMQTKHQISMARKSLYGIMLLGIVFSAIGAGSVPNASAQKAATATPSPQSDGTPQPQINAQSEPIPSQIIIQFKSKTNEKEKQALVKTHGGTIVQRIDALNVMVIRLPNNGQGMANIKSPMIESIEQDYYIDALDDVVTPNDPRYPEQWALPAIGAPYAWAQMPADAPRVTVAVIDSGICASHPDLAGRIEAGWDFIESDDTPQDDFGHGCSVSGVIAANMNDGIGIAGVAPNAQIMPLRVLNASGVGSYSDVSAAIVYAADNGAQVINLSLGGSSPSTTLENAVNYAIEKGVIVVAAAGNNGTEGALYPAAYPDVIAVGSVDPDLEHSSFSNYGSQIDIWAPGRDILTSKKDGSYGLVSGTSFAAPYVAGVAVIYIIQGENLILEGGGVLKVNVVNSENTIEEAINAAITEEGEFLAWPGTKLKPNTETIISTSQWAIAYLDYVNVADNSKTNEKPSLIILHQINNHWTGILPLYKNSNKFNEWLMALPEELARSIVINDWLLPEVILSQAYTLSTPWSTYATTVGGAHDGYARDFYIGVSGLGDQIVTAAAGTVAYVKEDSSDTADNCWVKDINCYKKANMVVINHGGYYTWYVHVKQWSVSVNTGDSVPAGYSIAQEGNTGYSSGPHLHFAVSTCANQGANMFWYHNCTPTEIYSFGGVSGTSSTWPSGVRIDSNNGSGGGSSCKATTTSLPSGYTKCAEEGSGNYCNFSGTLTVYYGANNCFDIENKSNGVECTNASFGGDPLDGVHKACYINNPPPSCPQSGGVILYWNNNYNCSNSSGDAGYRLRSGTGWQNVIDGSFNDKASSVRIPSGWSVMLSEHADRGGAKVCYNTNISDFGPQGNFPGTNVPINDQVSSMEVFNNTNCGGSLIPPAPSLSSPGNSSSNPYNYNLNFQWNSVSGATSYLVEWWGGPYSTMQPCGWSSSTSCAIGTVAQGHTYYWHVKSRNSYGESSWSPTWSFTIQTQPTAPSAPSLSSPGNGSSNPYNYNLNFQWNSVSGASEYQVEWWGGPYSTMQPCGWSTSTSCNIGTITPGNTYSWHVRARNSYGTGNWSPTWTFTIQPAPLPDLVPFPRSGASDPVVVSRSQNWPSTETLLSGQNMYFYWGFKNIGAANAGAHHVKVYVDNQQFIDYPFSGLAAGGTNGFDNWLENFYIAPGPHTVKIVVDANGEINESNESNNTWTGTVYWRDPKIDLYEVFTTDDLGAANNSNTLPSEEVKPSAYKDTFNPGDPIRLYLAFTNEFLNDRTFTGEWQVINPAGRVVPELSFSDTATLGSGGWWWWQNTTIPLSSLRGQYTFIGKITYNGVTTTQTTTFTVAGTPAVEVYDAFVTDENGSAASLGAIPERLVPSDVVSKSVPTFNAGEGIRLYIDAYNDVADGETATFEWEVIDPWGRWVEELSWYGELDSWLGNTWWSLSRTIPTHAITGDYTFTGYIFYGDRTTYQSQTFHVNGPTGPTNDNFNSPITINNIPYSNTQDTWGATVATTDPTPACGSGKNSNSVWYKYTAPSNGLLEIDTWGSDYDTVLAVWKGTISSLTLVQCNDDNYGYTEAWLENVPVTAGTTYYIEVMDYGSPGGGNLELYVNFASTPPNDDFNAPTTISSMPYSKSQDVRGATKASDDPSLTACNRLPGRNSVWFKYTTMTLAGQLDLDTIGSTYDTMLAVWTGTRGNLSPIGCNDDIGYVDENWDQDSILSVPLQPATTYYIEVSQYNGMIDINGASAAGIQDKPEEPTGNLSSLEDRKSAIDNGDITVSASQDARGGEVGAQLWGGQLQLHAAFHPAPTTPTLVSPANGATLARASNTVLDWNTTGTICTVHVWGGSIDISPSGSCADLTLGEQRGGTYSWQVTAENDYGSATSPIWQFKVRPYPATGLSGSAVSASQINLTWTLSSDDPADIDGYDIYKSGVLVGNVGAGINQYSVTSGITCNTSYTYLVRAKRQGVQSVDSNVVNITAPCAPTAFNKTSPSTGVTNQPVNLTLSWGVSSNTVKYEYCIDTINNNECDTAWVSTEMNTSVALKNLAPATTHYWQVRAVNSIDVNRYANTNTWYSFTTGILPSAFTKLAPSNNAIFRPINNLTLSWSSSVGATSYKYCYDTTDNNTCDGNNWTSPVNATDTSVTISGLNYDTTYYWNVRAANVIGAVLSDDNTWHSFTTGHKPGAFNKTAPANQATSVSINPTLSWTTSLDAASYEYCISTSGAGCTNWVNVGNVISTTVPTLSQNTVYYWNVRARNGLGVTSSTGGIRSFTTGVVPTAFNKTSPSNSTINLLPASVTLAWGSSAGVGKYEYCVDMSNDNACQEDNWIDVGTSTTANITGALTANTTYYWQVRTINTIGMRNANAGAWWTFKTMPLPGAFGKSAPANSSTGVSLTPTLIWAASANAVNYEYCLDTSDDNQCDDDSWTNNNSSTSVVISTPLLEHTTYSWQVRAVNSFGITLSNNNAWHSFTTGILPATFNKETPADENIDTSLTPTLSWINSDGAASYQYCIDTIDNDSCDANWSTTANTSIVAALLNPTTTYYWQVKAVNSAGNTEADSSVWWSFTTKSVTYEQINLESSGPSDGWILESTETSNKGGSQNNGAATFFLGDNAQNKQYRAILSFDTTLPSGAVITKVTLKIKHAGVAGTNPFSTHGNLLVDVRKGAFSNNNSLQLGDFQAAASKANVGNIPKTLSNNWYTRVWTSGIFDYINKSGITQLRLRFVKDDNNDFGADYLKIYSGDAGAANRPQLIIEYYVP